MPENQNPMPQDFDPVLDTAVDTRFSKFIKISMNFLAAAFYCIFNIPVFIVGILMLVETVYKWYINPDYSTHVDPIWFVYGGALFLLLGQVWKRTLLNLTSTEIDLIWAVNFKGKVKNRFHSMEFAQRSVEHLEEYVSRQMKVRERELLKIVDNLKDTVTRMDEAADFPTDIIQSLTRIASFFTDAVQSRGQGPRYNFESVMDHLLTEMTCIRLLHGRVNQASIMLLDQANNLRIAGSYNLHENVRRTRIVPLGVDFVGKVTEAGKLVWLDDITSEEAKDYGFNHKPESKTHLPYVGIVGYPIHIIGHPYIPIGIIVMHFNKSPNFTEYERAYISNTLLLFAQLITSFMRLHEGSFPQIQSIYGGADFAAATHQTME